MRKGLSYQTKKGETGFSGLLTQACLSFCIFLGGTVSVSADRLNEPSYITDRALTSPVFDIVRAGSRIVASGERGHILYSDDNGASWSQSQVPVRVEILDLEFVTPQKGWAVGHDTVVLKTEDGGESWERQLEGNQANALRKPEMEAAVQRLQAAVDGGDTSFETEIRFENTRYLLEEVERDLGIGPHKPLMAVDFLDQNFGVAVGANGLVLATYDGGVSWEDWSARLANNTLLHLYAVQILEDRRVMITGELGEIHLAQANHTDWTMISSPSDFSFFDLAEGSAPSEFYVVGMDGLVFRTRNAGISWQKIETGTEAILQAAGPDRDGRMLVVGLKGTALKETVDRNRFEPLKIGASSLVTSIVPLSNGGYVVGSNNGLSVFGPDRDLKLVEFKND